MSISEQDTPSTRPYLLRALHEWCCDNGFTPHLAVHVDASVQVPLEFVNNGEIVLNVSMDSTNALRLGNDFIEFKARFGGVVREIVVPVSHVVAIYARENGQGMAFPAPSALVTASVPVSLATVAEEASEDWDGDPLQESAAPAGDARNVLRSVPTPSDPRIVDLLEDKPNGDGEPPPDGPPRGSGRRPVLKRVK